MQLTVLIKDAESRLSELVVGCVPLRSALYIAEAELLVGVIPVGSALDTVEAG